MGKRIVAKVKTGKKRNDELSFQSSDDAVKKFWESWEIADALKREEVIKPIAKNLLRVAILAATANGKRRKEGFNHAFNSLLQSYLEDHGAFLREKYEGKVKK